ncbi:DUF7220 family protein [Gemmobacter caeruleus]|uniref:DUF7220 family protein n=1 Tax=Gemmobacter caeruleus TaxID=2595004 RepID=UPI0011EC6251|nr:hypothetical protein [Gemmobacter caeruleus]
MKQSRRLSFLEALSNVILGYGLAVLTQRAVFPAFGLETTLAEEMQLGAAFTAMSLLRSYLLRRLFAALDGEN